MTKYLIWLKAHEKLLIIVISAIVLFHLADNGLKAWQTHEERIATESSRQVLLDNTNNKQLQQDLTQLKQTVTDQQQQLDRSFEQRSRATDAQKKQDVLMTPSQLAERFQHLLSVGPQEVTPSENKGGLIFTSPAVQANVKSLEDLKKAQADIIDLRDEITGQESVVAKQDVVIVGLQTELKDEKQNHQDDVKALNAKSRHSWLSGFKVGVITGAIGGEAIRLFVFHKP